MRKPLPLHLEADNFGDPALAFSPGAGLFQRLRAEAARDLGLLSDAEMGKAEHRLALFNQVVLMNPFTGERRKVTL